MSRVPDASYDGFDIYTVVLPDNHGTWSAISNIERMGADGMEVFQDFGGPCEADSLEAAKAAVLTQTRNKIDDLNAEPV